MMSPRIALVLSAALFMAGCGQAPEKSIEKDCVRLKMFSELNENADGKKACACLSGKLKDGMNDKDLKNLAAMLKESKTTDDFDKLSDKHSLSEASAMVFMGAAKSCAFQ